MEGQPHAWPSTGRGAAFPPPKQAELETGGGGGGILPPTPTQGTRKGTRLEQAPASLLEKPTPAELN